MKIGGKYNWINQPDRLIYLGKKGSWHEFAKIGDPGEVWCEVQTKDLHMIAETLQTKQPASLSLQWCNGCGEGYVDFCRGNGATCPMKPIAQKEQATPLTRYPTETAICALKRFDSRILC